MKRWKVILEHSSKNIEIEIHGKTYSEAYLNTLFDYPESRIISIKTLEAEENSGASMQQ